MSVRLAFLGVAHVHAPGYAALLRTHPDVELLGFSEDDAGQARTFAERSGLKHLPEADLLAQQPGGVIVCAENARRLAPVQAAAAAGAHILCEKPIATTLADAQAMRVACERAGVRFVTAFPARFSPAARSLAAALPSLGGVLAYNGVNHSVAPDRVQPWFSDPLLAGGGAGMDHIVHLADLLRLFGEVPTQVYAQLLPVQEWTIAQHPDTDAAGLVSLTLASGAVASIDCSWSRPPGYPRWGELRLEVVAERGLYTLDLFAEILKVTGESRTWAGYGADLDAALLTDFLRVCRTGQPGAATWQDGYEALRVVLAAYASARSGQPTALTGNEV